MSLGLVPCETCTHRRGLHPGGRSCRQPGCECAVFVGVVEAPPEETPSGKVIQIAVPDGFMVTVSLYPVTKDEEEAGS